MDSGIGWGGGGGKAAATSVAWWLQRIATAYTPVITGGLMLFVLRDKYYLGAQ